VEVWFDPRVVLLNSVVDKWHWDSVLNFDLDMLSGAVFMFLLLLNPSNTMAVFNYFAF
jgi:hypothetical protein